MKIQKLNGNYNNHHPVSNQPAFKGGAQKLAEDTFEQLAEIAAAAKKGDDALINKLKEKFIDPLKELLFANYPDVQKLSPERKGFIAMALKKIDSDLLNMGIVQDMVFNKNDYGPNIIMIENKSDLESNFIIGYAQIIAEQFGWRFKEIQKADTKTMLKNFAAILDENPKFYSNTLRRTLIEIDGFENISNSNISGPQMGAMKSVTSELFQEHKATIIFKTHDSSKIDPAIRQGHRITTKIWEYPSLKITPTDDVFSQSILNEPKKFLGWNKAVIDAYPEPRGEAAISAAAKTTVADTPTPPKVDIPTSSPKTDSANTGKGSSKISPKNPKDSKNNTPPKSNSADKDKSFGEKFIDFLKTYWYIIVGASAAAGGYGVYKHNQNNKQKIDK